MNDKTKDLLKALPFDETFKEELLRNFDKFSFDQRLDIIDILWNLHATLYKLQLEQNLQDAMERVKQGLEHLDENFYARVHEKTDADMRDETVQKVDTADLEAARVAMERIIKEMKAAKMPLKVD